MKKTWIVSVLILTLILSITSLSSGQEKFDGVYGNGANRFSLATGSPGELGLVKALADRFTAGTNTTLLWKKAGSGESLNALQEKSVDMIMVHAPAAEKKAVEDGWAVKRTLIGSNEFFIVGPPDDPAKISQAASAAEAYSKIASAKAKFMSRGTIPDSQKGDGNLEKSRSHPLGRMVCRTAILCPQP